MKVLFLPIIINAVSLGIVGLSLPILPPVVPLLYGRALGEAQLVPAALLVAPPLAALAISAFNFLIAKRFTKDEFVKNILIGASILVSILSIITVIRIIFLVGF